MMSTSISIRMEAVSIILSGLSIPNSEMIKVAGFVSMVNIIPIAIPIEFDAKNIQAKHTRIKVLIILKGFSIAL